MSLESDVIVDRRRMRRKLTFWRVAAVLVAIVAVLAAIPLGLVLRVPHAFVLPVVALSCGLAAGAAAATTRA